jgi:hypothetical protein
MLWPADDSTVPAAIVIVFVVVLTRLFVLLPLPPVPFPTTCVQVFSAVHRYRFCPAVAVDRNANSPTPQVDASVVTTRAGLVDGAPEKSTSLDWS